MMIKTIDRVASDDDRELLGGASISADGRYRYVLWRDLDHGSKSHPAVTFYMLNPSTADATIDDPTIRRCRSFASRLGARRLYVVNLFAYRATDPKELRRVAAEGVDIVGDVQQQCLDFHFEHVTEDDYVIAAWGAGVAELGEFAKVYIPLTVPVFRLGATTKDGHPRHPLYLANDTPLMPHEVELPRGQ